MPTSQHFQISKIIDLVINLDPKSILDIGIGFGKYGVLCREYLELYDGREDYHHFLRRIDGIEIFKDYITPLHKFIYSNLYIGDALKLVEKINFSYDLVLVIDVLEHFSKTKGRRLLKKLLAKNKGIIISVPKNIGAPKAAFNNIYETHRSSWTKKDFLQFGSCLFIPDYVSNIVFLGPKSEVEKLRRLYFIKKIKKYLALVFCL